MSPQTTHPALLTRNIIRGLTYYHCWHCWPSTAFCALAARTVLSIHRSSCTILYFTTSFILPSAFLGMCGGSYV
ncbi:hypothetical protein DEU56DRAFT_791699, partial [Suillus clintonianus]|uniref:uncharacterized protein n=1 Tax=Suillus clintonianus TaxID=1904413 RepID=UPI001B87D145